MKESRLMQTVLSSNCCPSSQITKTRHISPALAVSRQGVFDAPLYLMLDKSNAISFKCAMQRRGVKSAYEIKVGATGSDSRILQTIQGIGSSIAPGNFSSVRSPVRSRVFSALTPGGGRGIPGGFGALKPERGYRCPEGYQFGGRFTDSRFSTCGKQLFDLPGIIGASIASAIRGGRRSSFQRVAGERVRPMSVAGEVIQSRAPQIPKVSGANRPRRVRSVDEIIGQMSDVNESFMRIVRRDGFVLEPVVSPAVLRTIPDNRDMDGATFILNALNEDAIGGDELGMLSNSGIEGIVYVLPGGSTLSIGRARPLTVGERRKLGRTVATAEKLNTRDDPSQKLKYIAQEMSDGIYYNETFAGIKNPNEIISVNLPAGRGKRKMRRWHFVSFYKNQKKKNVRSSNLEATSEDEKIKDLASAVRHLNNGGSIENLSSNIRSEAISRSAMYKTNKIKNGVIIHERADGQTVFEITPAENFEHLGAAFASELQRSMELIAPKVRLTGSGKKRNYMLGEAQDAELSGVQERSTDIASLPPDDVVGILISDFLTDTRDRNPSTIAPIRIGGRMRAVASLNSNSGLSGLTTAETRNRRQLQIDEFFNKKQRLSYLQYFENLRAEQRKKALLMFEKLIDQASEFDFRRFRQALAVDGNLSSAELTHMSILESIFEQRINILKSSSGNLKKLIGLSR